MTRGKILVSLVALAIAVSPATGQVDTGRADFSRYVSIGGSLAAGFSSGSLHGDGQALSFPSLVSLQTRGSADFEQPLVGPPGIPGILTLQSLSPLVIAPTPGVGVPLNLGLQRPYDNMAVPGARVGDVVRTRSGGLHPVVLRGLGTQLELVAALQPTFVTIWIGNNDHLAAVTSGIVIDGLTLTPADQFEADLRTIVGTLGAVGVGGMAIATIPSAVAMPFASTIPPVVVDPATNEPILVNGQLVPLIGPDGPLGAADKVLLPATAELARGLGIPAALGGSGQPLSDGVVLSAAELGQIESRREQYNAAVRAVANEAGAALVDMAAIYDAVAQRGITLGGVVLTADFLTGGFFSYDGIHASPTGYAIVANAFIEAINDAYDADIPTVALEPFLLGNLGRLPGSDGAGAAAGAGSFVFSARAYRTLRRVLNVPKTKKLMRIRNRRARHSASASASAAASTSPRPVDGIERESREARRERRRALRNQ